MQCMQRLITGGALDYDDVTIMQLSMWEEMPGVVAALSARGAQRSLNVFLEAVMPPRVCRQLVSSREAGGDLVTYQVVSISAKQFSNEPVELRRFVSFGDVSGALSFYCEWLSHQLSATGRQATCLTEWGPGPGSDARRKYICDIDFSAAALYAFGISHGASGCSESEKCKVDGMVINMGKMLSQALKDVGFVLDAPLFAIKTRHALEAVGVYKKLSYHLTIELLANYETLHQVVKRILDQQTPKWVTNMTTAFNECKKRKAENTVIRMDTISDHDWAMYGALLGNDPAVTNKPKGQPIQTLGSQKVCLSPALHAVPAPRFTFFGLFRSDGREETITGSDECQKLVHYLVTSMSMPSPFSTIVFQAFQAPAFSAPAFQAPAFRAFRLPGIQSSQSQSFQSMDQLPETWMRDLLMRSCSQVYFLCLYLCLPKRGFVIIWYRR